MLSDDFDPDSLRGFLAAHWPVAAHLTGDEINALISQSRLDVFHPGQVLIRQGQPVERLFWIHSGLMDEIVETQNGPQRRVGWLSRGDLIGDLALITGGNAFSTVAVKRHVVAISLEIGVCHELLLSNQNVVAALASQRQERNTVRCQQPRPGAFIYAAVTMGELSGAERIGPALTEAFSERGSIACVTYSHALEYGLQEVSPEMAFRMHDLESQQEVVFYFATDENPAWSSICQQRADSVQLFLPEMPSPDLVERLRGVLGTLRQVDLAASTSSPEVSAAAWAKALPERQVVTGTPIRAQDLLMGFDVTHDLVGRPNRLRQYALYSDLNDRELQLVNEDLEWRDVEAGTEVFTEGTVQDSVVLVESGRFRAYRTGPDGDELLAEIGPGEYFGETTALTDPTTWATVRATRDSLIGRLPADRFHAQMEEFPAMARGVSRVLARRFRETAPLTNELPPKYVAIVALTSDGPEPLFCRQLAESMQEQKVDACIVDPAFVERELGEGMSSISAAGAANSYRDRWFTRLEEAHEVIVCLAGDDNPPWLERCLRQADLVLLVANAAGDPDLRPFEQQLLDAAAFKPPPHLILLQPAGIQQANGTQRWLTPRPGVTHHHARADNPEDRGRIIRRAMHKAVGVAFSGASSRGVAHLGVLRALKALNLPFDLSSGSSSGAAAAALAVLGLSSEEMLDRALRFVERVGLQFSELQPPLTSLMSGKAFSSYLKEEFGDRRLEDQMIPCTLTGVDLNRHVLVRMRTGPIWLAVRASCSLPLFWPPVWRDGDLLVDGGLMSYLPINEILKECAGGLAVASDLDVNAGKDVRSFEGYDIYGDTLSSWGILAKRMVGRGKGHQYPTITDVLFHSMCLPSFAQQKRIRELSGHSTVRFVRPPLQHEGFFTVDAEAGRRYERLAFEEAMRQLSSAAVG